MNIKELPASIVDLPLFAGLSQPEIVQFLARCSKQVLSAGQTLMRAGELADSCYLILEGRVEVRARQNGKTIPIATLENGQLVGEMGLFRDKPYRMADAVLMRDSRMVQIPYFYLHRLEGLHPEIAAKLQRNLQDIAHARVRTLAAMQQQAEAERQDAANNDASPGTRKQTGELVMLVPIQIKMALARCPIFEGFDHEDLRRLIDIAIPVRYKQGEPAVLVGDPADCLYVIALGHMTVIIFEAGEPHPVAHLGAGQCFGELPLAHETRIRAASVVADTDATLLRLPYDRLQDAVSWRPQALEHFRNNLNKLVMERS